MSDIDLSAIRARLASASGPTFWRSLDEVAETPEFQQYLQREFPENAAEWSDPAGRRQFLKLMGASLALAGVTGCTRQPTEHIVPYVVPPEGYVPGKTQLFATAMPRDGYAEPVLAVSHHGRPIKIEPNPEHPAGGGTSRFAQASILEPLRPGPLADADVSRRDSFLHRLRQAAMAGALGAQQARRRRRAAHPDRHGDLADAGRADSRRCSTSTRRPAGSSTSPLGRDGVARGARRGVRAARRAGR